MCINFVTLFVISNSNQRIVVDEFSTLPVTNVHCDQLIVLCLFHMKVSAYLSHYSYLQRLDERYNAEV